jgi:hypothetical protein
LTEYEKYQPPDGAIESLARQLYPAMRSFFESEDGKREFAEWQAAQKTDRPPAGEDGTAA